MMRSSLSIVLAALLLCMGPGSLAGAQGPEKPPSADAHVDLIASALEAAPGGITAEEIVAGALETSPRLKTAGMQRDKAASNHFRAKLNFAPRFDARAGYTKISDVLMPEIAPGVRIPQVLDQYSVTGSVMLPITELFLVVLPTYTGAKRASEVAEHQKQAVKLQVSYEARVAFYEYVQARGRVLVMQDSARLLEAHVRDLEGLVKAGVATQTDLLRARAELGNTQALIVQLNGATDVAALQLSQLVGAPLDPARGIGEPLVGREVEATPQLEGVLSKAQAQRPELLALRTLIGARESLADARRGAQWPQLRGTANVYYANPNPRYFPQQNEWNATWDMGVALTWSPNDYAYARVQTSDAELDVAMVREDLRAMEDGVELEAAGAVSGHRGAREMVASNILNVDASRRYYEDQRALMLAGAATPNDVLEAENLLRRAELLWIEAFIRARMAHAALLKAQGETGLAKGPGITP